jgi:hypothetical protein
MDKHHPDQHADAHDALPSTRPDDLVALMGQYEDVASVVAAARRMRDAGYVRFDVHSPFPIHGIEKAIGAPPTILPWLTLGGGVAGFFGGVLLVWWTNATEFTWAPASFQGYEYLISGKPVFSFAANIPIIFETTILLAAFAVVLGMLGLNRLPMLYNPLFRSARFRRATDDRFFIVVMADDPVFDYRQTTEALRGLGATAVEAVIDPGGPSPRPQHDEPPPDREAVAALGGT